MNSYQPQSPNLPPYQPQSPDLSGLGAPQSPDLSGLSQPAFGSYDQKQPQLQHSPPNPQFQPHHPQQPQYHDQFQGKGQPQFDYPPQLHQQSPPQQFYNQQFPPQEQHHPFPQGGIKMEPGQHQISSMPMNGIAMKQEQGWAPVKSEQSDPTLGVVLKTSFPVARIKRIMQADEDVGKVAQVTPHVVSRALELFMIKLIAASSEQARGGAAGGKGPKRVLAQHMKKAIMADPTYDFLAEIVSKVPDAPTRGKKEVGSDSEDSKPKKRAKKRKDSSDDF